MESYNVARTIDALFHQLVENQKSFESGKEGILFPVRIDGINYGYEKDGNTHHPEWARELKTYIFIIILKGRYVFVNKKKNDYNFHKCKLNEIEWENVSNHVSCYRDAVNRIITDVYLDTGNFIWECTPKEHIPSYITDGVDIQLCPLFESRLKFVRVEHEALNIEDVYHRKITDIKEIIKNIVV